jgi:hypothetical protein
MTIPLWVLTRWPVLQMAELGGGTECQESGLKVKGQSSPSLEISPKDYPQVGQKQKLMGDMGLD